MAKYSDTFRQTISGLWSSYMEAIEHGEWIAADAISATVKMMEAAEIRAITTAD